MARRSRSGGRPPEAGPADCSRNAAEFVTMTRRPPQTMVAGQRYDVALTLRNVGTSVWRADGDQPYRLGAERPRDNTRWGIGRIDVPAEIRPGAEATFIFSIVAPRLPGRYHFQWRMVQDGVGWFGNPSPNIIVEIDDHATVTQNRDMPASTRL